MCRLLHATKSIYTMGEDSSNIFHLLVIFLYYYVVITSLAFSLDMLPLEHEYQHKMKEEKNPSFILTK